MSSSFASDMIPSCRFSNDPSGTIFEAKYNLAKAYQVSNLVVIGKAVQEVNQSSTSRQQFPKSQSFQIQQVIKGDSSKSIIFLASRECHGTACTGLSLPLDKTVLVLLRYIDNGRDQGKYHKVDGDGNDACPNIFLVEGNRAIIGEQRIEIRNIRNFLKKVKPINYP
ncbi:MAG: hypothetical protein ACKPCM_20425 [Pseudanabaena sp.]